MGPASPRQAPRRPSPAGGLPASQEVRPPYFLPSTSPNGRTSHRQKAHQTRLEALLAVVTRKAPHDVPRRRLLRVLLKVVEDVMSHVAKRRPAAFQMEPEVSRGSPTKP